MADLLTSNDRMTFSEFERFIESSDETWEFRDGRPVLLSQPYGFHCAISGVIFSVMLAYFKGKKCRPRQGMKVKMWRDKDDYIIPDLIVFCDYSKYTGEYYFDVPDLVVEIWSSSDSPYDREDRVDEYRIAGVKELWEIDYTFRKITRNTLTEDGLYESKYFSFTDTVESVLFKGLSFNLHELLIDEPEEVNRGC